MTVRQRGGHRILSDEQAAAMAAYSYAQAQSHVARLAQMEAYKRCSDLGLQHYYDTKRGYAKWRREDGEWRLP